MTVNNPQPYPQPYGQQPFGQQQSGQMGIETLNMSDALSIAWNHFTRQWVPWVLSSVIVAIAFGVPFFIMYFALLGWIISMEESATSSSYSRYDSYDSYNSYNNTTTEPAFNPFALGGISIAFMLIMVVGMVLLVIFTLNSYRNALRMTQGEVIKTTDFFRISGLGKPFLVQIVMGIAILPVALLTFGLGAIVLVIMWMYVMVAAFANPNASIGEIFGDGFRAFKNNMGQSILLVVVCYLINLLGGALMVGMLVTGPLQMIVLAVAYRMCKQMPIVLPQAWAVRTHTQVDMARALLVHKLPLCKLPAHSLGTTQLVVPRADTASLGMASQVITKQAMVKQDMARPATRSLVEIRSKADSKPRTRAMVTVASRGGNDQGGGQPGTGWQPWNQQ